MTDIIRIPNIENYTQEIINGELILTPKNIDIFINEENFKKIDFSHAKIIECNIYYDKNIICSNKRNWRSILINVWKSMPTQKILQNTTFNFKLEKMSGSLGYHWCPIINMSFQNKDSRGCIEELITMLNLNKYNMYIKIELKDGTIINFNKKN